MGFLTGNKQVSFKFDKNGAVGPIPALERATIFISDGFVAPGLFPFAATVRDALNPQQSSVNSISGSGITQTINFPTVQPGLYEVYGWSGSAYDLSGWEGDAAGIRFILNLNGVSILDVGWGNNGGRQRGAETFNLSGFGTGQLAASGVGPTYTLNAPNLAANTRYNIYGWGAWVQDAAGSVGDGKTLQANLNHVGTGSLNSIDSQLIQNGGLYVAGARVPALSANIQYQRPLEILTPNNSTNLQLLIISPATFTSSQNVYGFIRSGLVAKGASPVAVSHKTNVVPFQREFTPPLLVQVPNGVTANFQIVAATPQITPLGSWGLDGVVYYAPLKF